VEVSLEAIDCRHEEDAFEALGRVPRIHEEERLLTGQVEQRERPPDRSVEAVARPAVHGWLPYALGVQAQASLLAG
jgi:hypothetical protein